MGNKQDSIVRPFLFSEIFFEVQIFARIQILEREQDGCMFCQEKVRFLHSNTCHILIHYKGFMHGNEHQRVLL